MGRHVLGGIISSVNTAYNALRKTLSQIVSNLVGIILWMTGCHMKLDDVVVVVADRLYQSTAFELELIFWRNDVIMHVLKYTKEE